MAVGLRAGPGNGGEYPLTSILRLTFNGKARHPRWADGFPDFHLLPAPTFAGRRRSSDGATLPFSPTDDPRFLAHHPAEGVDAENEETAVTVLPPSR